MVAHRCSLLPMLLPTASTRHGACVPVESDAGWFLGQSGHTHTAPATFSWSLAGPARKPWNSQCIMQGRPRQGSKAATVFQTQFQAYSRATVRRLCWSCALHTHAAGSSNAGESNRRWLWARVRPSMCDVDAHHTDLRGCGPPRTLPRPFPTLIKVGWLSQTKQQGSWLDSEDIPLAR